MASNSLGTLTLDLIARIGGFTGPLDKASRDAQKRMAEIKKAAIDTGKTLGTGIAAGATIVTGALTAMLTKQLEVIGNQDDMANRLGTSVESLVTLTRAAELAGVGLEQLEGAGQKLELALGKASQGGKAQVEALDRLGLSYQELSKLDLDKRILTINEAIAKNIPLAEQAAVAATLYGAKNAAAIRQLDPDTLAEAARQVQVFGLNLSAVDSSKVEAAGDAISVFSLGLDGIGRQLAVELAPLLTALSEQFVDSAEKAGGLGTAVHDSVQMAVDALAFLIDVGDGIKRVFIVVSDTIIGTVTTATGYATSAIAGLIETMDSIPGVDLSESTKSIREFSDEQLKIAREAASNIQETLDKPLAGQAFKQFYEDAQKAGQAAAEAAVAGRKLTESGKQTGAEYKAGKKAAEDAAKAAEQAAKALQKRFDDAETGYEREIALINTEVDKRKDATEVAKLQFEIESGKLKGINAQQQERLNKLATELDRLQKLKQANEDAAKAAAFRGNLRQENSTAREGMEMSLAGLGLGDKGRERLVADLAIQQDFNKKFSDLQTQYNTGDISKSLYDTETQALRDALKERLDLQHRYYEQVDEAQEDWAAGVNEAFQNYVDSAENHYQIAADAVTNILGGATDALSDSIYDVFTGTETLSDSLGNLAAAIGETMVKAIADMAAQWLVAQAVQLMVGKTTQASAATALSANAQATALQAGLAAFASTAAIPIVGPIAAPGAMTAALAVAEPMAASIGALALSGMAHDGIDSIPQDGTWFLQKGERVTTAETSAKLDATLSKVQEGMSQTTNDNSKRSTVINFYQQGGMSSREQKASTAKAARQISQAVDAAQRYS